MSRSIPIDLKRLGGGGEPSRFKPASDPLLEGIFLAADNLRLRHLINPLFSSTIITITRGIPTTQLATLLIPTSKRRVAYSIRNEGGPSGQTLINTQTASQVVLAGATASMAVAYSTYGYEDLHHYFMILAAPGAGLVVDLRARHPFPAVTGDPVILSDIFNGAMDSTGAVFPAIGCYYANTGNLGAGFGTYLFVNNTVPVGDLTFGYTSQWGKKTNHPLNTVYLGNSGAVSNLTGLQLTENEEKILILGENTQLFGAVIPILSDIPGVFTTSNSVNVKITALQ